MVNKEFNTQYTNMLKKFPQIKLGWVHFEWQELSNHKLCYILNDFKCVTRGKQICGDYCLFCFPLVVLLYYQ